MHLYNDHSPIPPKGQIVQIICPRTKLMSNMDCQLMGISFIEAYSHDLAHTLVRLYLEYSYQGITDKAALYANILIEQEVSLQTDMEYIYTCLLDECEKAEANHPIWAEDILAYFGHDVNNVCSALNEIFFAIHVDIFYPVLDMIQICTNNGLTLTPSLVEYTTGGTLLTLEIMTDEYAYSEYDAETYPRTPFRLGIPPVRTTAEIRPIVDGHGHRTVYSMLHPYRSTPYLNPLYA